MTLKIPNVDPNQGLTQLPQSLVDTNRILENSCIVRDRASGGVFLITGTGGLPLRLGDPPLPTFSTGYIQGIKKAEGESSLITGYASTVGMRPDSQATGHESAELSSNSQNAVSIVEAQGIYSLSDGQLVLSWECN